MWIYACAKGTNRNQSPTHVNSALKDSGKQEAYLETHMKIQEGRSLKIWLETHHLLFSKELSITRTSTGSWNWLWWGNENADQHDAATDSDADATTQSANPGKLSNDQPPGKNCTTSISILKVLNQKFHIWLT
jgi:hypothetical protein